MNRSLETKNRLTMWSRRLAAALFAVLIVIALAELGFRFFAKKPEHIAMMPLDPVLGFRMRSTVDLPNQDGRGTFRFELNEDGFRGRAMPLANERKSSDSPRALLVGDSFLNAWAVREEELMSNVAERELARTGADWKFYVAASDGYGTGQELLLLRKYGARVQPDVVILVMFPANDVLENSLELAGRTLWRAGDYTRPYFVNDESGELELTWAHPWRSWMRQHSRLFAQLEIKFYLKRKLDRWDKPDPWPFMRHTRRERVEAGLIVQERDELYREQPSNSPWSRAWETTEMLLTQFNTEVKQLGAELLVLVVPEKHQVRIGAQERLIGLELAAIGGLGAIELDQNLPERRLAAFFREQGIAYRLMLEPLRESIRSNPEVARYVLDGHLSGAGHELGGVGIARWIQDFHSEQPDLADHSSWNGQDLSAPVDHLSLLANQARMLDFRKAAHAIYLSNGWLARNDSMGHPGWTIDSVAFAVLPPPARAKLILRGQAMSSAQFPLTVQLSSPGTGMEAKQSLEAPGPFEVILNLREAYQPMDCVPVRIACIGGNSSSALVIEELGQSD